MASTGPADSTKATGGSATPTPTPQISPCQGPCSIMARIAQAIGKTDDICDPDSDFISTYTTCAKCVEGNNIEILDSLTGFLQFVEFCDLELRLSTTTRILPGWSVTIETIIVEAATAPDSSGESTVTSQTTTTWTTSTTPTTSGDLAGGAGGGGGAESSNRGSESKAWIAGPVVGGIVGLWLILGFAFWLRRRRRRAASIEQLDAQIDKPQLHGDSLQLPPPFRAELHPDSIHEMDGSPYEPPGESDPVQPAEKPANEYLIGPQRNVTEKPANEVGAHEMATPDERSERTELAGVGNIQERRS